MRTYLATCALLRSLRRLGLCATALIALAGCSALNTISAISPPAGNSATGIEYSARTGLKLDVYLPDSGMLLSNATPAVIVFFYGGGWEDGAREKYRFAASQLTRLGHIVVIPDYRKYPEVVFPGFMEDAAEAVDWVQKTIADYGGDPDNVWLAGHSAGAHIAALLNYDESWLTRYADGFKPCGLLGLAGPYDFLPLTGATLKLIFPPEQRFASQPINFVDGSENPALLIHGARDVTVEPRNSIALADTVNAAGGSAKLVIYPEQKHAGVVLALAKPFGFVAPVTTEIDAFVGANRCPSPR